MPSNEADRIVHQRAMQQQQQAEEWQRHQQQQEAARMQSGILEIEAEIPIILRLLAERGYPGVEEVVISDYRKPNLIERLLGAEGRRVKAGWKIGVYIYQEYGEATPSAIGTIFLLSDGRICMRGRGITAGWPRNMIVYDNILQSVLEGLHRLRSTLEAGGEL